MAWTPRRTSWSTPPTSFDQKLAALHSHQSQVGDGATCRTAARLERADGRPPDWAEGRLAEAFRVVATTLSLAALPSAQRAQPASWRRT